MVSVSIFQYLVQLKLLFCTWLVWHICVHYCPRYPVYKCMCVTQYTLHCIQFCEVKPKIYFLHKYVGQISTSMGLSSIICVPTIRAPTWLCKLAINTKWPEFDKFLLISLSTLDSNLYHLTPSRTQLHSALGRGKKWKGLYVRTIVISDIPAQNSLPRFQVYKLQY